MQDHVVFIQHGMCATPEEMNNLKEGMEKAFPGRLHVVNSHVNYGCTTDGVAAAGDRLAALVRREAPPTRGFVSFVGHSMGGVIARWAIKVLEEEDWFDSNGIHAANFITTASPHLGIADIGAFWRWCVSLFGRILGATVQDLGLQTEVMAELAGEDALRGLSRFARRVVYGNLVDDVGVRPCTSLILPSQPNLPKLTPGIPHAIPTTHVDSLFASSNLSENFPRQHITVVCKMLEQLNTLSWERYVVYFPYSRELGWRGDAHHKICNHGSWDPNNCGAHVVSHMCQHFVVDLLSPSGCTQVAHPESSNL
jgi:hypothetical protein